MIALIQRVMEAQVRIEARTVAAIGTGVLALIGVRRTDTELQAERLAARLLAYRIFADDTGRMNLSVPQVAGAFLLVPQFTLAADTSSGTRAGFSTAAQPFSLIPTMWALPSVQPALYYRAFLSGFPIRRSPCPYYQTWQLVVSCVRTTRSSSES